MMGMLARYLQPHKHRHACGALAWSLLCSLSTGKESEGKHTLTALLCKLWGIVLLTMCKHHLKLRKVFGPAE